MNCLFAGDSTQLLVGVICDNVLIARYVYFDLTQVLRSLVDLYLSLFGHVGVGSLMGGEVGIGIYIWHGPDDELPLLSWLLYWQVLELISTQSIAIQILRLVAAAELLIDILLLRRDLFANYLLSEIVLALEVSVSPFEILYHRV